MRSNRKCSKKTLFICEVIESVAKKYFLGKSTAKKKTPPHIYKCSKYEPS